MSKPSAVALWRTARKIAVGPCWGVVICGEGNGRLWAFRVLYGSREDVLVGGTDCWSNGSASVDGGDGNGPPSASMDDDDDESSVRIPGVGFGILHDALLLKRRHDSTGGAAGNKSRPFSSKSSDWSLVINNDHGRHSLAIWSFAKLGTAVSVASVAQVEALCNCTSWSCERSLSTDFPVQDGA